MFLFYVQGQINKEFWLFTVLTLWKLTQCIWQWTLNGLRYWTSIYIQSSRCVPVLQLKLGKQEGGQAVGQQTRKGDRQSAEHKCCDICPLHAASSLLLNTLSWVWMPGQARMGQPEGSWLRSVVEGEDVTFSFQPLLGPHGRAISWH